MLMPFDVPHQCSGLVCVVVLGDFILQNHSIHLELQGILEGAITLGRTVANLPPWLLHLLS